IANNTWGTGTGFPHVFRGNLFSQGHNLIETVSDFFISEQGDITGQDPLLDPVLRNNGGTTQTHALLPSSPAINAGSNANTPVTDQRGLPRIVAGAIDIGAYEEQAISFCTFTTSQSLIVVSGRGGNGNFN